MKLPPILSILLLATIFHPMLHAQDIPDSRDPVGLERYEGTRITFFEEQSFAAYTLPLGKFSARNIPTAQGTFAKSEKLEGKVTRITYAGSDGKRTSLEVFRNYQSTLSKQGWEVLWTGTDAEMGDMRRLFADRPGQTFTLTTGGHFLAAKKGSNHLALFIANFKNGVVVPASSKPTAGAPVIALDVIESAAMDEKMVVIKADAMASALLDQGGINLYGFHFDTASALLKSDSNPTLDEVEKLLKADASLRLLVVGHTDGIGGFEENIDLSKRRAAAVITALSERVPNVASRLTPCGVGLQCPIASNSNEEGRAKNRRVALVKVEK